MCPRSLTFFHAFRPGRSASTTRPPSRFQRIRQQFSRPSPLQSERIVFNCLPDSFPPAGALLWAPLQILPSKRIHFHRCPIVLLTMSTYFRRRRSHFRVPVSSASKSRSHLSVIWALCAHRPHLESPGGCVFLVGCFLLHGTEDSAGSPTTFRNRATKYHTTNFREDARHQTTQ